MQQDLNDVQFLVGNINRLDAMSNVPALPLFAPRMIEFFSALSNALLRDKRSRDFVHVTAYAYWIRRASLEREKNLRNDLLNSRLGRGIAFHIAPSNVPLAFAMSFTIAALAGNANIVRLSRREFVEAEIILDAVNDLLESDYSDLQRYFCLVRYPHDDNITRIFSELCDLRIIWGGDNTINTIRKIPIPSRSIELTFADRHSIALIQADEYLKSDLKNIAKKFYDDTYDVDQNACNSPRAVVWFGKEIAEARKSFWTALQNLVHARYEMYPVQAIDKYSAACMLGMEYPNAKIVSADNFEVRVEVDALSSKVMNYKPGGGYFIEYIAQSWAELLPLLNKQCQTVAVLGIDADEFRKWIISQGVRGVDRVVPIGETNRLNFMWDGFDLIQEMSRFIEI